ncbi:MAG: RAD55 family ATPase [Thermoplasmata archaeon]|nr:RAD55 family ATPase [Thermoplasmata archaeon]
MAMFPKKYSILIIGPSGAGVFDFCAYLASFYLRNDQSVVFIETDTSRSFVRRQLRNFGIKDIEYEGDSLAIIDCFSEPSLLEEPVTLGNPANLPELLQKIEQTIVTFEQPVRVILDSLSSLHLYNGPNDVNDFLVKLSDASKKSGSLTTTMHSNLHTPEQIELVCSICDGVIEMRVDEDLKKSLRISKMKDLYVEPNWVSFELEPAENIAGSSFIWKKD